MTEDQRDRYYAAAHAVQAGTKVGPPTSVMDCRIGLNVTKAEAGGLAKLLIDKGVFTEDEYAEAMIWGVLREKERMEAELSKYGPKVTLA
jgi:hypothetical protein